MEFFVQELTLTALFTVILYWVIAMYVSDAVGSSSTHRDSTFDPVDRESVVKDDTLSSELRVAGSKDEQKVKFVDDAVITSVDRCNEGLSESAVFLDDVESMSDLVLDEECLNDSEINDVKVDSASKISVEQGINVREMNEFDADEERSEKIDILVEKKCGGDNLDGVLCEKEENLSNVMGLKMSESAASEENDDKIHHSKVGNESRASEVVEGLKTSIVNEFQVRDDNVDDIDDWEGIERSELEKNFAKAVNYVEYGGKEKEKDNDRLAKLSSDEQMHLYGLHKLAVEGPCLEPQPMALKVSARAKWNAWQRLGNMSPEVAMEQYIKVLADNNPQWMNNHSADKE